MAGGKNVYIIQPWGFVQSDKGCHKNSDEELYTYIAKERRMDWRMESIYAKVLWSGSVVDMKGHKHQES